MSDLDSVLASLREQFGAKMPSRLEQIEGLLTQAKSSDSDQDINALLQEVHKLHGTAGSYGFREVGNILGELENSLREAVSQDSPINWMFIEELATAVRRIGIEDGWLVTESKPQREYWRTTLLVWNSDRGIANNLVAFGQQYRVSIEIVQTPESLLAAIDEHRIDGVLLCADVDQIQRMVPRIRACPGGDRIPIAVLEAVPNVRDRVGLARAGVELALYGRLTDIDFSEILSAFAAARSNDVARVIVVDPSEKATAINDADGIQVATYLDANQLVSSISDAPDIILIGDRHSVLSGMDVLQALRLEPTWRTTPAVLLSDEIDTEIRIEATKAGFFAVWRRDDVAERLRHWRNANLVGIRAAADIVSRDSLTGVLRREAWIRAVGRRLQGRKSGQRHALAVLDLDHFKQVNDKFGHELGDQVLANFGFMLRHGVGHADLVGRWGGEEFVIWLEDVDEYLATQAIERLQAEWCEVVVESENGAYNGTFSAGVALHSVHGADIEAMFVAADQALYEAKNAGRDTLKLAK